MQKGTFLFCLEGDISILAAHNLLYKLIYKFQSCRIKYYYKKFKGVSMISSDKINFIKDNVTSYNIGYALGTAVKAIQEYPIISSVYPACLACLVKAFDDAPVRVVASVALWTALVASISFIEINNAYHKTNINRKFTYGAIDRPKMDEIFPEKDITPDNIFDIFRQCNLLELEKCSQVSAKWNHLANDSYLKKEAIFKGLANNPCYLNEYFGQGTISPDEIKKAFDLLPNNIDEILKMPCLIFPGKSIRQTHNLLWIPESINGKELNVNNFGELLKQLWPNNPTGYQYIDPEIATSLGDSKICSGWMFMTRDVLPNSRSKSYTEHEKMISDLYKVNQPLYEIPSTGEAIFGILHSKEIIFGNDPQTFTRTKDSFLSQSTYTVGAVNEMGINIQKCDYLSPSVGVAAIWRLPTEFEIKNLR